MSGLVDTVAGTTYGSIAVYTCNPGYNLQGARRRSCLATGNWDELGIACIVKGKVLDKTSVWANDPKR